MRVQLLLERRALAAPRDNGNILCDLSTCEKCNPGSETREVPLALAGGKAAGEAGRAGEPSPTLEVSSAPESLDSLTGPACESVPAPLNSSSSLLYTLGGGGLQISSTEEGNGE